ncbi:hypothetical protein [uncultured Methylophaga sp.]|uniref:hypothetical protein n=1 Tax=uncultured Methylophaga sp. TaxID=285271 RepID=UPI00260F23E7|nr:hypothetical protein [uncultured Methylophaga sp.]
MAHIQIDKSHKALIKAATGLGDWLLSLEQLSDSDRQAVRAVQKALQKLPKINDGTLAMYGFSIEKGSESAGLVRGWDVSLEYFADDPEQQGGLELFSSYIPIPETTDANVLAQKKQHEAYFHWPLGDVCNLIKPEKAHKWIDEVSRPEQTAEGAERLRIEIVYGDVYAEVDVPLA